MAPIPCKLQEKTFSNTTKSVVFGWFNGMQEESKWKCFVNVYIFVISVLGIVEGNFTNLKESCRFG